MPRASASKAKVKSKTKAEAKSKHPSNAMKLAKSDPSQSKKSTRSSNLKEEAHLPKDDVIHPCVSLTLNDVTLLDDWFMPINLEFVDAVKEQNNTADRNHPREALRKMAAVSSWDTHGVYDQHPLMYMILEDEKSLMLRGFYLNNVLICIGISDRAEVSRFVKKFVKYVNQARGSRFPNLPKATADGILPQIGTTHTLGLSQNLERFLPTPLVPFVGLFVDPSEVDHFNLKMQAMLSSIYRLYNAKLGSPEMLKHIYLQFAANNAIVQNLQYRRLSNLMISKEIEANKRFEALESSVGRLIEILVPTRDTQAEEVSRRLQIPEHLQAQDQEQEQEQEPASADAHVFDDDDDDDAAYVEMFKRAVATSKKPSGHGSQAAKRKAHALPEIRAGKSAAKKARKSGR